MKGFEPLPGVTRTSLANLRSKPYLPHAPKIGGGHRSRTCSSITLPRFSRPVYYRSSSPPKNQIILHPNFFKSSLIKTVNTYS
jgi:hypothetical protein